MDQMMDQMMDIFSFVFSFFSHMLMLFVFCLQVGRGREYNTYYLFLKMIPLDVILKTNCGNKMMKPTRYGGDW